MVQDFFPFSKISELSKQKTNILFFSMLTTVIIMLSVFSIFVRAQEQNLH